MKTAPLVVLMLFVAAPVPAQDGTDTKAKLAAGGRRRPEGLRLRELRAGRRPAEARRPPRCTTTAKAVLLRAKVNFELGEFGKASTYAERAAELDRQGLRGALPVPARSKFQQAEALKSSPLNSGTRVGGFYEGALGDFEKALKLKPDSNEASAMEGAGALLAEPGAGSDAGLRRDLRKARPDDPEPLPAHRAGPAARGERGRGAQGRDRGARDEGRLDDPGRPRDDRSSGILGPRQKFAELFAAFKAWSAAHPQDPLAYLWMGYTRFMEKNFDEAVTHYQKGFEVSGKKHGGLALELGNAFVQKAISRRPRSGTARRSRSSPSGPNYKAGPLWMLLGVSRTYAQKARAPEGDRGAREERVPGRRLRLAHAEQPRALLPRLGRQAPRGRTPEGRPRTRSRSSTT